MRILLFVLSAFVVTSAFGQMPDDRISEAAPDSFVVAFESSAGPFEVKVTREWSPAAADRLYHLVRVGYFDDAPIYRVVYGFVAQFGIPKENDVYSAWRKIPVPDEPTTQSNLRGRVSFARGGPQTRTTQLFINLGDNVVLDSMVTGGVRGYPPIGEVVSGMSSVDSLYSAYGNAPSQRQRDIALGGREWLEENFPGLDWIVSARLKED